MKKLFVRILYTLIGLSAILFIFLIYTGLFVDPNTSTKEIGPYTLVYKTQAGKYNQTGEIITKVSETLNNEYNIECSRTFAIFSNTAFLGIPQEKNNNTLISQVGCIINPEDEHKIKENFTLNNFNKQLFFVAEFPYKTKFSVKIAADNVFPVLKKAIQKHNYRKDFIMEIYDEDNDKILYLLMPNKTKYAK